MEHALPTAHSHMVASIWIAYGPLTYGGINLNTNIYSVQAQCTAAYLDTRCDGIKW
jgi:hypothetical protein